MLSKLILSGLSLVSLGLTALGADYTYVAESEPSAFSDANTVTSMIQGNWVLGCTSFAPSTSWPPDDSQSAVYTYSFSGNDFTWVIQNFSDTKCKKPLYSRAYKGTFKVADPIPGLENVYGIDLLNIAVTYKLLDPSARVYDFCGSGDNVLTGESQCTGSDLFQILRPDSRFLRFGAFINYTDGDSPDSRPRFLSDGLYNRQ